MIFDRNLWAIQLYDSFKEASKHELWNKVIEEEVRIIEKNERCKLVDLPANKDVIGVK